MIEDDDDDSDGLDGDDDEIDDEIETLSNGDGSNNNKVITHIEYNMIFEFCKKTKTNSVRKCYAMLKMRVYYFPFWRLVSESSGFDQSLQSYGTKSLCLVYYVFWMA